MERNAKDLSEVLNSCISSVMNEDGTFNGDNINGADTVRKSVGQLLKLSALELAYSKAKYEKPGTIPSLER